MPAADLSGGEDGVSVAYLNVGGLRRFTEGLWSDFVSFLLSAPASADILCLGETWLLAGEGDSLDLRLPGYVATHFARPRAAGARGRPAGGISVYVHQRLMQLRPKVTADPSGDVVWINMAAINLSIAACYFSPQGTPWFRTHGSPFATQGPLMQGILRAQGMHHRCLVVGDMNARVGDLSTDIPPLADAHGPDGGLFNHAMYSGIPYERTSADATTNKYGRDLLATLQATELVLLNGRAPGDPQGASTYTASNGGSSVVDLVAVSAGMYAAVREFSVVGFDLGGSAGHDLVRVCMSVPAAGRGLSAPRRRGPKVVRPDLATCLADADTLEEWLHATTSQLQALHSQLQAGTVDMASGLQSLTRLVGEGCRTVIRQTQQREEPIGGQGWWDEECLLAKTAFVTAWKAYLDCKHGHAHPDADTPAAPPSAQDVADAHAAGRQARSHYEATRKAKKASWLEDREKEAIKVYFSTKQRDFWSWFKGGRSVLGLQDIEAWTRHFQALLAGPGGQFGGPCPPELVQTRDDFFAHSSRVLSATQLTDMNAEISNSEVKKIVLGMKSGKAAGPDGLTNEALKLIMCAGPSASDALAGCLAALLNLSRTQPLPMQMTLGKLVPVPKGKASSDPNAHRGIVVSSVFSRLLDLVLYTRGNAISEDLNLRAATQCGFREHYGTLDALFTLQHFIDKARFAKRPLIVTAADIAKAFDATSREGMLDRCQRLGFHGAYAQLLARTYEKICVSVEVSGAQGEVINTTRGTKQGSELSPLIFGWFIEQFTELLAFLTPGESLGVRMGAAVDTISHILYADDVLLLADTEQEMQRLLDILGIFCDIFGLQVNTTKTHSICFCPSRSAVPTMHLQYKGVPIDQVSELPYLGLTFHQVYGLHRGHVKAAKAKGYKALWAYTLQLRRRKLRTPDLVRRLFDLLVEPTFSYGCQIWGPDVFCKVLHDPLGTELQCVQSDFLRSFCGLGKSVHRGTLLHEFGMMPVSHHWVLLSVRLWNKLATLEPADRMLRQAFDANVELFLQGCQGCWVWKVLHGMAELGFIQQPLSQLVSAPQLLELAFDEEAVAEKLKSRFLATVVGDGAQDPRTASGPTVLAATYNSWVGMGLETRAPHDRVGLPYVLRRALVGLRVGAHNLEVATGRFRHVARANRVCRVCSGGQAVEDVGHFLLECPAYQSIKARFRDVFDGLPVAGSLADKLKHVFGTSQQAKLAQCVLGMFQHRDELLAEESED